MVEVFSGVSELLSKKAKLVGRNLVGQKARPVGAGGS